MAGVRANAWSECRRNYPPRDMRDRRPQIARPRFEARPCRSVALGLLERGEERWRRGVDEECVRLRRLQSFAGDCRVAPGGSIHGAGVRADVGCRADSGRRVDENRAVTTVIVMKARLAPSHSVNSLRNGEAGRLADRSLAFRLLQSDKEQCCAFRFREWISTNEMDAQSPDGQSRRSVPSDRSSAFCQRRDGSAFIRAFDGDATPLPVPRVGKGRRLVGARSSGRRNVDEVTGLYSWERDVRAGRASVEGHKSRTKNVGQVSVEMGKDSETPKTNECLRLSLSSLAKVENSADRRLRRDVCGCVEGSQISGREGSRNESDQAGGAVMQISTVSECPELAQRRTKGRMKNAGRRNVAAGSDISHGAGAKSVGEEMLCIFKQRRRGMSEGGQKQRRGGRRSVSRQRQHEMRRDGKRRARGASSHPQRQANAGYSS